MMTIKKFGNNWRFISEAFDKVCFFVISCDLQAKNRAIHYLYYIERYNNHTSESLPVQYCCLRESRWPWTEQQWLSNALLWAGVGGGGCVRAGDRAGGRGWVGRCVCACVCISTQFELNTVVYLIFAESYKILPHGSSCWASICNLSAPSCYLLFLWNLFLIRYLLDHFLSFTDFSNHSSPQDSPVKSNLLKAHLKTTVVTQSAVQWNEICT